MGAIAGPFTGDDLSRSFVMSLMAAKFSRGVLLRFRQCPRRAHRPLRKKRLIGERLSEGKGVCVLTKNEGYLIIKILDM